VRLGAGVLSVLVFLFIVYGVFGALACKLFFIFLLWYCVTAKNKNVLAI